MENKDLKKEKRIFMKKMMILYSGHTPLVQKWVQDLPDYVPESAQRLLQALLDKTVVEGLNFVKRNQKYQKVTVNLLRSI